MMIQAAMTMEIVARCHQSGAGSLRPAEVMELAGEVFGEAPRIEGVEGEAAWQQVR